MTERLYYGDSYLVSFRAAIAEAHDGGRRVYLNQTAFYPASGGQPNDLGTLAGLPVTDVIDEGDRVAHVLAAPCPETGEVEGSVDWARRFDHMQQHSGQHLLSAVLAEMFGLATVSFHLGAEGSTIDLATPSLPAAQLAVAERRANEIVCENRPVAVGYEDAAGAAGLRKASERTGALRIVSIEGLDRSACGGTHVRATGEIGPLLLRKTEKIRGNVRVEFLCGARAVRRARADFDALARIAALYSSSLDEAPELAAAQLARLQESEKARRKLAGELALRRGHERYAATAPTPGGLRFHEARVREIDDEARQEAQGFAANPRAVYFLRSESPAAFLLASSADSGLNAGQFAKEALNELGGRGGGSAQIAQGTVPDAAALEALQQKLTGAFR